LDKLGRFLRTSYFAALLFCFLAPSGCGFFSNNFETASAQDQKGENAKAIRSYQSYLKRNPGTVLKPRIYYRVAVNYSALNDYSQAIGWYEKVLDECQGTDEELQALLDLAALYHEQIKDEAKAAEYNEKAFKLYVGNLRIRGAVQNLLDAQLQTANAYFLSRNFKQAGEAAERIFQTYPSAFIPPDSRAKVESLVDRTRRANDIANIGVDRIILKSEAPFNKSYENDFPVEGAKPKALLSPDGGLLVLRHLAPNGVYYLYLAKTPAKDKKAAYKLIGQTFGAGNPCWSPDSSCLIYTRRTGALHKLEKTNVKKMSTQTMFFTRSSLLGLNPSYHPSGSKIAFVYEGKLWLINNTNSVFKSGLKTSQKLDYTALLSWSFDGTMVRYRQADKAGKITTDRIFHLDVSSSNIP
jgi:tetratricopeptide (TPR) repeat protein